LFGKMTGAGRFWPVLAARGYPERGLEALDPPDPPRRELGG